LNGTVRTSGQVAGENPDPDVQRQTEAVLRRIDEVLAAAGTDKSRLLSAEVYLADMAEFPAMNAAWDMWVDPEAQPIRVTIQTPMTQPEWRVAIAVEALVVDH
jgi:enamine deaminase RidA (YjgF/YER057c/UK114 family)